MGDYLYGVRRLILCEGGENLTSNRIREIRESIGWNQRELAEAAHVCQTTISELEREVRKPWPAVIKKLSRALKVKSEEIFPLIQSER